MLPQAILIGVWYVKDDSYYLTLFINLLSTTGHNNIVAGIIISLKKSEVCNAPSSTLATFANTNQMANSTPTIQ